ncbi:MULTISPECIES: ELWxxDGT repeat protein [unclassified Nocardioides]|uniref:ELWxxDGT repeat protein n=1 Tax=unclassified Nocardioides TaxID=2615069 RepID=UPI0007019793|nr:MULTISPECIES: ELWxxDGT repeat protein [unclassified Nocardioides]KRA31021.1 hypothetical protein ASD81_16115 [Nocardioides sp. Root614]KRA87642.1 hypothetical protein ASD84_16390 [Nocardioides sp. Root682]
MLKSHVRTGMVDARPHLAVLVVAAMSLGLLLVRPTTAEAAPLDSVAILEDLRFGSASGNPRELTDVAGNLFFAATDEGDTELWMSDGTFLGTNQVHDINLGPTKSSSPRELTAVGRTLFFAAFDGNNTELWKSDGTRVGTQLVRDLAGPQDAAPIELTAVGRTLFFSAFDGKGRELFKSDGTFGGTGRVKDIGPGDQSGHPLGLTDVAGTLFFTAVDDGGRELWTSNGTEAGTVRLKDINPGSADSNPTALTAVGDTLYFTAYNEKSSVELWKSDGSPAGTVMVKELLPGVLSAFPVGLTAVDDTLFFAASDGEHGKELWTSDGTAAGTGQVADLATGPSASQPTELTAVDDRLFFSANVGGERELWTSDGTANGTTKVKDINPGVASSTPNQLVAFGGVLYFSALDAANGRELWRSDGTGVGTERMSDIVAGAGSGEPKSLTAAGPILYMSADDVVQGRELWSAKDTIAPDTIITSGPAEGSATTASRVTIGFRSDDSSATFECRVVLSVPGDVLASVPAFKPCTSADAHVLDPMPPPGTTVDFAVRALDGAGNLDSTPARRTFTTAAAVPPVAVDDVVTVVEDAGPTKVDVLANDSNPQDGPVTIVSVGQPGKGTAVVAEAGSLISYEPHPDQCTDTDEADTFGYTLNGGSTAKVSVTIVCVDDAPVAVNDDATALENAVDVSLDVLANDTDPDGGPLLIASVTQPSNGTVRVVDAGSGLRYSPTPGHCSDPGESDSFEYALNGGSRATVTLTVACAPRPPDDSTPPETVITTAPNLLTSSLWLASTGTFSFSSSEPGSTFECRVDTGPYVACASPHRLSVPFGQHTFAVRARDASGNVDPTPATLRVLQFGL